MVIRPAPSGAPHPRSSPIRSETSSGGATKSAPPPPATGKAQATSSSTSPDAIHALAGDRFVTDHPASLASGALVASPTANVAGSQSLFSLRLDGHRASAPALGTRAFEAALDKLTGSVARPDNRVELLFDGASSFPERDRMIDGAKESIHLQTFVYADDSAGWDLSRRLAKRAQEGVKVRVIYDAVGSLKSDREMFDYMRKHGVEVREHGPLLADLADINERWHEKHLIVDGKSSIQGGMNIGDEYALGGSGLKIFSDGRRGAEPFRDVDMKLEGPAVNDAQRAFLKNWEELGPGVSAEERASLLPPPTLHEGGPEVRVVQHRPDLTEERYTNELHLQCIRSAQQSVTIENAYFIPPKNMREELCAAAKRGVDVRVLTNSYQSNNHGFVSDTARYFYDEMIAAGVKIYEKTGESTLHSKTATFDGAYSIVGSCNLNGRSKYLDSESVLAVACADTASQLEERFRSGLAGAKEVTAEELGQESFFTNLKQWALSTLAATF